LSLVSLVLALLAQHVYPPAPRPPLVRLYGRACLAIRQQLDAGDRNSGMFGWLVLMAVLLVPMALLTALAARIHPAALILLDVAVLYGSLRFLGTTRRLSEIEKALRAGDAAAALSTLGDWQGQGLDAADGGAVARVAAEHGLREAHQGTFALLFWFLVLPGPIGVVMYAAALRAARSWEHRVDAHERDFGWFAARAFAALDWIPQRVSAFAFAVVGDFEDALFCWRTQAATWKRPEEAVVLAAGAGALKVRLGEPIPAAGAWVPRATLGVGEAAGEDAIASLEGMLWRALVLWLVVYVLALVLQMR
jgi:cobalamin biosynthesis protein CobD/CbiB